MSRLRKVQDSCPARLQGFGAQSVLVRAFPNIVWKSSIRYVRSFQTFRNVVSARLVGEHGVNSPWTTGQPEGGEPAGVRGGRKLGMAVRVLPMIFEPMRGGRR